MNKAWAEFTAFATRFKAEAARSRIAECFKQDPNRFADFSVQWEEFLLDYSKQKVTPDAMAQLFNLAKAAQLPDKIEALFAGKKINASEQRAVLHTALRDSSTAPLLIDGQNIKADIAAALAKMDRFVSAVHARQKKGITGLPLKHFICLGIGGSGLGPALVCEALAPYQEHDIQLHFVSNIDGETLERILNTVSPAETFCFISSKTFSTLETCENALKIKHWFEQGFAQLKDKQQWQAAHLGAITAALEKAMGNEWGISEAHIFPFWSWVGGRFSVWSSVGLPIALAIGMQNFRDFLAGAEAVDRHFRTAPLEKNIPVLMALLGIWNINGLGYSAHAILPYADALRRLPSYCQQLEMESNGKAVNQVGEPVAHHTAPIIWGDVGCDGQHAYMQLLHQGTVVVPVDFLVPVRSRSPHQDLQALLVANALSQSKALMEGRQDEMTPLKTCDGDRPSSTLMFSQLTPKMLGKLLSLYEHKVFVQGVVWSINSFDQWGVELGKQLTQQLLPRVVANQDTQTHPERLSDGSTEGLLAFFHQYQGSEQDDGQDSIGDGRNRGNRDGDLSPAG